MHEPRGRRAVMNEARRRVERDARVAEAAVELAEAAEAVLRASEARGEVDARAVGALRAALERYRQASRF